MFGRRKQEGPGQGSSWVGYGAVGGFCGTDGCSMPAGSLHERVDTQVAHTVPCDPRAERGTRALRNMHR